MSATIGIVRGGGAEPDLATVWPRDGAEYGGVVTSPPLSAAEIAQQAALIVVSLPPEEACAALSLVGCSAPCGTVVVCTASSLSLDVMRKATGGGPALLRAMVFTGGDAGRGLAVLAPEPGTAPGKVEVVRAALAWVGAVYLVTEETLDTLAALAAVSSASVRAASAGMEEGGVDAGLPRETARALVSQTALATALLLRDRFGSPADLKDQVASPGGTTIAALATLEDAAVRGALLRVVQSAALEVRRGQDAARPGVVE
jgi:pyrroline-5-carboxylate reductase